MKLESSISCFVGLQHFGEELHLYNFIVYQQQYQKKNLAHLVIFLFLDFLICFQLTFVNAQHTLISLFWYLDK